MAETIGLSRNTVAAGLRELKRRGRQASSDAERVRRYGGGRKRLTELQPKLVTELEALVEPTAHGDPQSPLRWTTLSVRKREGALRQQGLACPTSRNLGRYEEEGTRCHRSA